MAGRATVRALARQGIRRYFRVTLGAAGFLCRALLPGPPRDVPGTILVIRLDLLGDIIFSMPGVEALRAAFPGARIVMLTLPYTAPVARLYPAVDEVIAVDTNRIRSIHGLLDPGTWREYWRVCSALRRERFDVAVSFSGAMASLWALLSGAPRRVGYTTEAYPFVLTEAVAGGRFSERKPDVEYVNELIRALGVTDFPERADLRIPEEVRESANAKLEGRGIKATDPILVFHAGAGNGAAKRWPVKNWARLSDQLQGEISLPVVLVGGPSDVGIAEEIQAEASRPIVSLVGETSVEQLAAILSRADLVLSSDSGPLHLAVALDRPVVGVFGPTDPRIHGPYRPRAPFAVLRRDLVCSPCYTMAATAECPLGDPICMRLVSVSDMSKAALTLLRDTSRPARPRGIMS